MIKLIILDFDGTLGDTRANIVLTMRQTLAKLGYPARDEETIAATIGLPLEKGFEQLFPGIDADGVALCTRTYRAIFAENRKLLYPRCSRMCWRRWRRFAAGGTCSRSHHPEATAP